MRLATPVQGTKADEHDRMQDGPGETVVNVAEPFFSNDISPARSKEGEEVKYLEQAPCNENYAKGKASEYNRSNAASAQEFFNKTNPPMSRADDHGRSILGNE